MRRSPIVLATLSTLALAGCSGTASAPGVTTSTVVVNAPATTPGGTSSAGSPITGAPTTATATLTTVTSPDATTALLRTATIPALADRPSMTLHGGKGHGGAYDCSLDSSVAPALADIDSDGGKEAVGALTCSGGTSPAELVVVDHDGTTLVDYPMPVPSSNGARVRSLAPQAGAVTVTWTSFSNAGSPDLEQTGALRVENGTGVYTPSSAPTPAATTSTAPPTPGAPPATVVAPAPAGATTVSGLTGFASPSGGILCAMDHAGTRCDVLGATFTAPPKPSSCEWEWGFSLGLTPGRPGAFECQNDPAYGGGETSTPSWFQPGLDGTKSLPNGTVVTTLGYGHALANATTSCVIAPDTGVTCRSLDGAHGFTASKRAYRVW